MNVNKKNNMPFVSIIIPVYNSQKYLKTTVESLLSQTYRDFEIILVDDGSTDTSGELCDDLVLTDSRVSVIHKTNGGVSDARNVGIERAKGELIWFVDHDYIQQMEDLYKRILENWSIKDKDYIQKIKIRIAIRIVHYLLKGYLVDTRVSRKERLRRWNNAKKDSFTNLKVVSYLNYKEKFIYLMARLGGYQVLDPLILWLVDRINR